MKPDPSKHNPEPEYLRRLVALIGLSQRQIAKSLDINESQFRAYLVHADKSSHRECPYVVQYALERMCNTGELRDIYLHSASSGNKGYVKYADMDGIYFISDKSKEEDKPLFLSWESISQWSA